MSLPKTFYFFLCAMFVAAGIPASILAQTPELYWGVGMSAVFDNRECDTKYTAAKTFFQTQLAPEIGISVLDDTHRVAAGAVWTQPIGCEWDGHRISPTVYYRYQNDGLRFAMGMFGRDQLYAEMPNYIWNDSVKYAQRNVRGAMVGYRNHKGYFQAILDWRGMQTETQREAFNVIANGERHYDGGAWLWGGLAMMNHLAKDKNPPADQHVIDNFLVNPYMGANLSKSIFNSLDSCTVRLGALTSLTRDRGNMKWKIPIGLWVDIDVAWRFLEVKNTLYSGGKLFPYHSIYGATLDQGEPYYSSGFYNRTSIFGRLIRKKFVDLKVAFDFNFAPGNMTFYQRVIFEFNISNK